VLIVASASGNGIILSIFDMAIVMGQLLCVLLDIVLHCYEKSTVAMVAFACEFRSA